VLSMSKIAIVDLSSSLPLEGHRGSLTVTLYNWSYTNSLAPR